MIISIKRALIGALLTGSASCGDGKEATTGDAHVRALQLTDAPAYVRACEMTPAALGFNLADETYSANVFPLVQKKCARCHAGDQNDKQNSTTCGFLEKNIDNVIKRLQNGMAADALKDTESAKPDGGATKLTDDQIRNQVSGGIRAEWPMPPVNRNRNQNPSVTNDDIALLTSWKDAPNKCLDPGATPEPALPTPTAHSSDDEERAQLAKAFGSAVCEDGPAIADQWGKVAALVAVPEGSPSSFYDYAKEEFVAGATTMPGDCTIDTLIAMLKPIAGAETALNEYKSYGWRAVQCAMVGGRPRAYLAQVARVPNALGDMMYGVYLKDLHVEQRP